MHTTSNDRSIGATTATKIKKKKNNVQIRKKLSYMGFFTPEAPVDRDVIIQQDIRQASFGAELCYDADVRDFNGSTNELA